MEVTGKQREARKFWARLKTNEYPKNGSWKDATVAMRILALPLVWGCCYIAAIAISLSIK